MEATLDSWVLIGHLIGDKGHGAQNIRIYDYMHIRAHSHASALISEPCKNLTYCLH